MGHSESDPAAKDRRPWNAGRKLGGKRALKPQQVWAIRFWLEREHRLRDRAMFDLAIDSKLRGCDVVKIKIGEITIGGQVRSRQSLFNKRPGGRFSSNFSRPPAEACSHGLSTEEARSTISCFPAGSIMPVTSALGSMLGSLTSRVTGIGLRAEDYGTHSLRRTKASIIYKQTGNLRAVQILFGHTKIESTVRYLGVDIEDALTLAEGTEI
jgi:site-specific recombinase XerC